MTVVYDGQVTVVYDDAMSEGIIDGNDELMMHDERGIGDV